MNVAKNILLLILGFGLVVNCNKDDDSTPNDTMFGTWNLKNVSGGLSGVNIDYTKGDVKWIFNNENNTLIIENNIMTTGPKDIYAGLNSGTYKYKIEQKGETKTLFIEGAKKGVLFLVNNKLKINDGVAADGLMHVYER